MDAQQWYVRDVFEMTEDETVEMLLTLNEDRDYIEQPLQVLSMGAGVQSTAMLQMVVNGDLPRPDLVLFSDTGAEMPETYAVLETVIVPLCASIDLPFQAVQSFKGPIDEWYLGKNMIPLVGIRSCTDHFKIRPVRKFLRRIVGNGRGTVIADCWLGITIDEQGRMADSFVKWCSISFPLIVAGISRDDCQAYNEKHGLIVGKSGCYHCPYQSDAAWVRLLKEHPDLFDKSVNMEEQYFANRDRWKGLSRESNSLKELIAKIEAGEIDFDDKDGSCSADWNCFL